MYAFSKVYLKNYATLLQEKLASRETKTLALVRLGRQLAEWERISEKLERFFIKNCRQTRLSLSLSTV
jgi:hypothetical protein